MTRSALQSLPGASVGLVRKYVDKTGQRRIVGVPDRLRQSQWLVCIVSALTLIWLEFVHIFCRCKHLVFFPLHQGLYSSFWKVPCAVGLGRSQGALW